MTMILCNQDNDTDCKGMNTCLFSVVLIFTVTGFMPLQNPHGRANGIIELINRK